MGGGVGELFEDSSLRRKIGGVGGGRGGGGGGGEGGGALRGSSDWGNCSVYEKEDRRYGRRRRRWKGRTQRFSEVLMGGGVGEFLSL